jgi:hypothetical protein
MSSGLKFIRMELNSDSHFTSKRVADGEDKPTKRESRKA